jgi:hypothetical protein
LGGLSGSCLGQRIWFRRSFGARSTWGPAESNMRFDC